MVTTAPFLQDRTCALGFQRIFVLRPGGPSHGCPNSSRRCSGERQDTPIGRRGDPPPERFNNAVSAQNAR